MSIKPDFCFLVIVGCQTVTNDGYGKISMKLYAEVSIEVAENAVGPSLAFCQFLKQTIKALFIKDTFV
jgi:hypothetical protein